MTIQSSSVSGGSGQYQGVFQQRAEALRGIGSALGSGDLATAQQAFTTYSSLPQVAGQNSVALQNSTSALGTSLFKGDLATSKAAFASLLDSLQSNFAPSAPQSTAASNSLDLSA